MKALTMRDLPVWQPPDGELEPTKVEQPRCPRCNGAGYYTLDVHYGHPKFGVLQMCECKQHDIDAKRKAKEAEAAALLDRELGNRYQATFEQFTTDWPNDERHRRLLAAAKTFCEQYAAQPAGWIMLHGRNGGMCGSGKSHLAAAIARANAGSGAAYATVPDLFSYILSDWNRAEQRIEALSTVSLLVLDDMGQEAVSGRGIDQFKEKFFRVLNNRERRNMPTVITSNYTLDELGELDHYSEAIVSRMYGQTEGRRILLAVPDYRRRKK